MTLDSMLWQEVVRRMSDVNLRRLDTAARALDTRSRAGVQRDVDEILAAGDGADCGDCGHAGLYHERAELLVCSACSLGRAEERHSNGGPCYRAEWTLRPGRPELGRACLVPGCECAGFRRKG